ncbi:hypothetical protein C1I95_22830 [Micromonospora craterilacus]|uniref:Class I SAM-dependent methyltransferase n=1 Tax=Micromonospora craterilacus TaxID=1655439 RepID=A0A2W2DPN5_9ACTN|nr:NmrA family NAD(P)-binding protein [Micromonospora craterilacus]PZG13872.1 hypothetical protein C1I95_22830 [Micromonospora craterilacus]
MTDNGSISVEVVRGEMQPWTDWSGGRAPAGGPVLTALLADLLPSSSRALVVGPHGSDVVDAVAARSAHTTVLVRSVSDAEALRAATPSAGVTIVAGSLDGFVDRLGEGDAFDLVLAADGVDRVMSTDSSQQDWQRRATALARTAAAGAVVLVAVWNDFALTELFDRRPAHQRHGDDEWWPLHDDPSRPTSPAQVRAALAGLGLDVSTLYSVIDVAGEAHTLIEADAAAGTRPGHPAARLAVRAVDAAAADAPLLAPLAESVDAAARAGQLGAVTPGWLAVCGPVAARTVYARSAAPSSVLTANLHDGRWQLTDRTGDNRGSGDLIAVAGTAEVPDTESVERLLLRAAAAEDVPEFRRIAGRLGDWARKHAAADSLGVVRLDDTGVDGDTFASGVLAWRTAVDSSAVELLSAAWHRFHDRLVGGHHRHPWPPWMTEQDLVRTWLGMSGEEPTTGVLAQGRQLADQVAAVADVRRTDAGQDLRTSIADADAAKTRAAELAGHVFGLERTLKFRDQQLKVRENRLRALRTELRNIKGSRAAQVAEVIRKVAVIRDPKRVARAVKRRLPGR